MAFVLAGGRGSRLMELTDRRAKPAVFFAGTSRIIDFALSNALNSGIRRICVATQYKAHSLIRHLQRGRLLLRSGDGGERDKGRDYRQPESQFPLILHALFPPQVSPTFRSTPKYTPTYREY
jgi:ADP-glucose pyrophosphorylase